MRGAHKKPSPPAPTRSHSSSKAINVLLVGEMGVGKSSFGNFLFNLGAKEKKAKQLGLPFRNPFFTTTRDGPTEDVQGKRRGCTQFCEIGSFEWNGVTFNIIDTPGLGEQNPLHDLEHAINVAEIIRELGEIHCVCLVSKFGERVGAKMSQLLHYHRILVSPLLRASRFFCIFTHLDSSSYYDLFAKSEDDTTLDSNKHHELREVTAKNYSDKWGSNVSVEFLNCAPSQAELGRILKTCKNQESPLDEIEQRHSDDVISFSIATRQRLLCLFSQLSPVPYQKFSIPLPPSIDDKRKAALDVNRARANEMADTVQQTNQTVSDLLRSLNSRSEKIREIAIKETEKATLAETQYTPPIYHSGSSSFLCFYVGGKKHCYCPIEPYPHPIIQKHNADWVDVKSAPVDPKDDSKGWEVSGKVHPATLQIVNKPGLEEGHEEENFSWFIRVVYEYDGGKANKQKIEELEEVIAMLGIDAGEKEKEEKDDKEAEEEHDKEAKELELYEKQRTEIEENLKFYSQTSFSLDELLKLCGEYTVKLGLKKE